MDSCPVCLSTALTGFLYRDQVPVHQNLVFPNPDDAVKISRGVLEMVVCNHCGFVFNRAFEPEILSYGEHYDNTQSCSPYFESYLDERVRYLVETLGITDATVIEVGCGKGQFLRKLAEYPNANIVAFGFDPSYTGPDSEYGGKLKFFRRYYSAEYANIQADIVICRHVIEHVNKPVELLGEVRQALASSPATKVFFETPSVRWIFTNQVIWDFFYEHCSLFSGNSLTTAFERAGFKVENVNYIFGDQYVWVEAEPASGPTKVSHQPGDIVQLAVEYGKKEKTMREDWVGCLNTLRKQGLVAIWGAGAKGATFANLLDPDCLLIDCIVDMNPNKIGNYLPGTGHPIVDYKSLPGRNIRNVILMNPNYYEENRKLLDKDDIDVNLVNWN